MGTHSIFAVPVALAALLASVEAEATPLQPTFQLRLGVHGTFAPMRPIAGGFGVDAACQVALLGSDVTPVVGPFGSIDWTSRNFVRFAGGARIGAVIAGRNDDVIPTHHVVGALENDIGWAAATKKGESGILVGPVVSIGIPGAPVDTALAYHAIVAPQGFARDHVLQAGVDGEVLPNPQRNWVEGRPFRVRGRVALPAIGTRAPTRDRIGQALLEDGRAEWASVPAFLRLAAELAEADAPEDLVLRCLRAAMDEVGHAERCFALAAERLRTPIVVGALPAPLPRAFRSRREALRQIGHESWHDGWVGEGAAAERARHVADRTPWEALATAKAAIAREETEHAQLGHDIAGWCAARA